MSLRGPSTPNPATDRQKPRVACPVCRHMVAVRPSPMGEGYVRPGAHNSAAGVGCAGRFEDIEVPVAAPPGAGAP